MGIMDGWMEVRRSVLIRPAVQPVHGKHGHHWPERVKQASRRLSVYAKPERL